MTSLLDTAANCTHMRMTIKYTYAVERDVKVAASKIDSCVVAINNWTASNRLKLNPLKTELVWFASPHGLTKFVKPTINVGQT